MAIRNFWLTCITIDQEKFGATREDVRVALAARNIDARPIWKPLHLQPVFAHCRGRGGAVAETAFERGLCLPSGSNLTDVDFDRVCAVVLGAQRHSIGDLWLDQLFDGSWNSLSSTAPSARSLLTLIYTGTLALCFWAAYLRAAPD